MILFPLSWPAKIVLILIAIFLGFILYALWKPERFKKWFRKGEQSEYLKSEELPK